MSGRPRKIAGQVVGSNLGKFAQKKHPVEAEKVEKDEDDILYRCCCVRKKECNTFHKYLNDELNISFAYIHLPNNPAQDSAALYRKNRALCHLYDTNIVSESVGKDLRFSSLHLHHILRAVLNIAKSSSEKVMPYYVSQGIGNIIGLSNDDIIDNIDVRNDANYYYIVPHLGVFNSF